ncbi:hypothetical protein GCM10011297_25350 [Bacterioplanes sanyensis]|uniref:hypothetical protein n=1 Tax=Bacterioplanes sanyensis TaxID=1249553 RepID=UPI001673374F|nr:hypothetical protein [Bacterioplanes sanyensis]GGY51332.1 hypothetical protein GCM10011297_25350 [Bacterioplanes sanyensis]
MSEEFSFSVSFKMPTPEHMEAFSEVLEHLELYEEDEAEAILQQHQLEAAQALIPALTSPHSSYHQQSRLVKMYIDTYEDSHCDASFKVTGGGKKGKIKLEGSDHDADDVCAALVLLLIAMEAQSIQAMGGSDFWTVEYHSSADGHVSATFTSEGS